MNDSVQTTKDYYDSEDAQQFYSQIWGGEDIHIGIYSESQDSISLASQRTVEFMADLVGLSDFKNLAILDIGSGFGGSGRYIARHFNHKVECLNLSTTQNDLARRLTVAEGLEKQVTISDGSFEELPYQNQIYDLVWSQDALLHSRRKLQVLREVFRVLKPGGRFVFSDPMQSSSDETGLDAILNRIHLESLGDPESYLTMAEETGFSDCVFHDRSTQLPAHYQNVYDVFAESINNKKVKCSELYAERMLKGLLQWVNAGKRGKLCWGVFVFNKPAN